MNWMRFRPVYILFSGTVLVLSVWAIFTWGFRLSIDFTGGSIVDYSFEEAFEFSHVVQVIDEQEYDYTEVSSVGGRVVRVSLGADFSEEDAEELADKLGAGAAVVRFETVGPKLSEELLKKTYFAVGVASVAILLWIAWVFRDIKFGLFAIAAMVHDVVVILGVFAILGYWQGVKLDILFVTAILTTLSLSIYDTVVVYDRIRETTSSFGEIPFFVVANKAVTESIVRSLNTSFTTSFVLVALFLFGGESIKWFVLALLVGLTSGTYSSLFVAVPLLVSWDQVWGWWRAR